MVRTANSKTKAELYLGRPISKQEKLPFHPRFRELKVKTQIILTWASHSPFGWNFVLVGWSTAIVHRAAIVSLRQEQGSVWGHLDCQTLKLHGLGSSSLT